VPLVANTLPTDRFLNSFELLSPFRIYKPRYAPSTALFSNDMVTAIDLSDRPKEATMANELPRVENDNLLDEERHDDYILESLKQEFGVASKRYDATNFSLPDVLHDNSSTTPPFALTTPTGQTFDPVWPEAVVFCRDEEDGGLEVRRNFVTGSVTVLFDQVDISRQCRIYQIDDGETKRSLIVWSGATAVFLRGRVLTPERSWVTPRMPPMPTWCPYCGCDVCLAVCNHHKIEKLAVGAAVFCRRKSFSVKRGVVLNGVFGILQPGKKSNEGSLPKCVVLSIESLL